MILLLLFVFFYQNEYIVWGATNKEQQFRASWKTSQKEIPDSETKYLLVRDWFNIDWYPLSKYYLY